MAPRQVRASCSSPKRSLAVCGRANPPPSLRKTVDFPECSHKSSSGRLYEPRENHVVPISSYGISRRLRRRPGKNADHRGLPTSSNAGTGPIQTPSLTLTVLCATALTVVGILLLRASWLSARRPHRLFVVSGWLLIAASFAVLCQTMSGEVAAAYGALAVSLAAYAVVAVSSEVKNGRSKTGDTARP